MDEQRSAYDLAYMADKYIDDLAQLARNKGNDPKKVQGLRIEAAEAIKKMYELVEPENA